MSTIQEEDVRKGKDAGGEGGGGQSATLTDSNVIGNNEGNGNIRRYLVLLQDCLAIKFVSISQLQQKRFQQRAKSQSHHFPQCTPVSTSASTECYNSHCSCSDDAGFGGDCQATTATSGTCNCYKQGRKCELTNEHNNQQKPISNLELNDGGDHQECQYYRQMSYPRMGLSQTLASTSYSQSVKATTLGSVGNNVDDHVNHQIPSNKSNKSCLRRSDYDNIGCVSPYYSRCSSRNVEWESDHQKHLKKLYQHDPTQKYCLPMEPNEHEKGTSTSTPLKDESVYSTRNNICRAARPCLQDNTTVRENTSNLSMMTKVDHSMQALFLFKEFREINLRCFWNSAVHEAFKQLEYKGSVVPSTIIVGSPIRKHLNVLKTAWSRKMLRSPSGYLIDFLGEIEELIADPIAKSHFVPLSDSLCWAIHELTSSGQEAFVDDIFLSLASAFPGMALPTKELIYQTLEKLTRERKIYQTAQGYFVVTPDTHRYISSTEPLLMQSNRADSQMSAAAAHFLRNTMLLQQGSALRPTSPLPPEQLEVSVTQDENLESRNAPSPDPDTYSLPYGSFRRYNSLRIKKSSGSGTSTGCLPRRTLSMRLSKSKKKGNKPTTDQIGKTRADVTDSFQNLDSSHSQPPAANVNEQLLTRRRKHKSFLSRLLSFRGVRKSSGRKERGKSSSNDNKTITKHDKSSKVLISSNDDDGGGKSDGGSPVAGGTKEMTVSSLATISTQTSTENLNQDLALLSLVPPSKSSTLEREDSDSGRCTDSHSDADAEITAALNRGLTPIMSDHLRHHTEGRRRDMHGCNVYEKIESDLGLKVDVDECDGRSPRSPSSQMSVSPSPSTFTTTSATLSRGNSMNRQNIYSRCHSSASSSGYSYRDFYNLYRRRYPSYYQQSTPTSLESTELNEGLKFKPPQPIRYPPRSFERKQIFDEINRSSFREKKHPNRGNKSVSIAHNINGDNNGKLSRAGQHDSSESIVTGSNNNNNIQSTLNRTATPTSTTITQTVKNSTNLELEFRLPLGSILSAAMGGNGSRGNLTSTMNPTTSPPSSDKLGSERSVFNESGHKGNITRERESATTSPTAVNLSEINTMVNDLFTIKSFVKSNPFNDELSSTIEFKTRGNSGNITNHNSNLKSSNNNGNHNRKEQQRFVIEAVSSKPFAEIHENFNRESEII